MDAGDADEVVDGEDLDELDGRLGLREADGVRAGRVGARHAGGVLAVRGEVPA